MPVSLVKRAAISPSFLSDAGAKLFQQRYEISRCWPRAGATPLARMPASHAVAVTNCRRVTGCMSPPPVVRAAGAAWLAWNSDQTTLDMGAHPVKETTATLQGSGRAYSVRALSERIARPT